MAGYVDHLDLDMERPGATKIFKSKQPDGSVCVVVHYPEQSFGSLAATLKRTMNGLVVERFTEDEYCKVCAKGLRKHKHARDILLC